MAGTRHFAEFADEQGDVWRINIHDASLPGGYTATEFKVGAEGFVLSYSGNNEQQHQPIVGSSVEFTFYEETAAHTQTLDLFYSNPEGRMLLEIYRDPDGTPTLYWRGVILAEQVTRMDEAKPTAVRITASDDLGNLKDIEFDVTLGGLGSSGLTVKNHLVRCLSGLRTVDMWASGDALLRYVNDAEGYHATQSSSDPLSDMTATIPVTVEDDGTETAYNCFDILSGLATAMNARVFHSEGVFWFYPINVHQRIADSQSVGSDVKQYDKDAAAVTWSAADISDFDTRAALSSGTDFYKLAGHSFTHLPPAKSVTRTRLFNGNMYVDAGNDDTVITSGWNVTLEDNGRTYDAGSRFRLSGFVEFQVSPDASYIFAADDSRVHVEVETLLQCGTKFYQPETWGASPSARYVVDVRTFDRSQGVNMSTAFSWITDDLPSEQTNLDAYVVVKFFDQTNANVTADFVGEDFYIDARIEVVDDNGANADEIVYRSTSTDENVVEVEQGECIFGDPISYSAQGKIRPYINGVGFVDGQWKSSQTTGPVALHRLGVDEALARQRYATKIHSGTIYQPVVEMWMTIVEDSDYYVPFQLSATMNTRETMVERYKIAYNSSGITSADDNPRAGGGTRGSTLDLVAVTANTITAQVQQPKPSVGVVPDNFTAGRAIQTTSDVGPLFTRVTTVEHTSGSTLILAADGYGYAFMSTYIDSATGFGSIYLPKVADSEGRTYKFETDDTITSTKYVKIGPDATEYTNGVRIDGDASFAMDRAYDGIEVMCIGGTWFVTDRKEKDTGGAVQYHGRYDTEAETQRSGATANVEVYYTARPDGDGYAESETDDTGVTDTINRTLYYSTKFDADPDTSADWTEYTTQPADNETFANALAALLDGLNETDATAETRGTLPLSLKMVRTTTPAVVNLLLDDYPGAAFAVSTRKLDKDYTGYCMKVRRASDNVELDIGFDVNGDVDSAAIAAHCGASAGYVSVWYDQAGTGKNLTQTTTGNQPQIYNGTSVITENGKPALQFDGTNDGLNCSTNLRTTQGASTVLMVRKIPATSSLANPFAFYRIQRHVVHTGFYSNFSVSTNRVANQYKRYTAANMANQILQFITWDGTTASPVDDIVYYQDGTAQTGTNGTGGYAVTASGTNSVGYRGDTNNQFCAGTIQEVVVYLTDQSSNRTGIESDVNGHFSVY